MPEYGLQAAADEFAGGAYDLIITCGGPLPEGFRISGYASYADFAAAILLKLGFPRGNVVSVPAQPTFRHRTYHSAVAVGKWIAENGGEVSGVNVVTLGTHGRRTWIVFRQVLSPSIPVGVVSVASEDYDSEHWWRSSEGVKTLMTESLGWMFEKFLHSMRDSSDATRVGG